MTKRILAVSGFAGSGKDTLGAYVVDKHGFRRRALADPLKEVARLVFDFSDEQLYGSSSNRNQEDKRFRFSGICLRCHAGCRLNGDKWLCAKCAVHYDEYLTPRIVLQTLGTEWGRTLYPDVWVDMAIRGIQSSHHDNYVVTDVRFKNEMAKLRAAGAVLVRLTRGRPQSGHQSEQEMLDIPNSDFDFVIDNQTTLEFLYFETERVLSELGWV